MQKVKIAVGSGLRSDTFINGGMAAACPFAASRGRWVVGRASPPELKCPLGQAGRNLAKLLSTLRCGDEKGMAERLASRTVAQSAFDLADIRCSQHRRLPALTFKALKPVPSNTDARSYGGPG